MSRAPLHVQLRADLLAGRFPWGEPLVEGRLTELYDVSRTPVREALSRLEQEGLIVRSLRGYRIQSGTPEDVIDIYDVRIALEQAAAEAAAVRRTDLQLAELTQLQREAEQEQNPVAARHLHARWHESLWAASENTTLITVLQGLIVRLRIFDQDSMHRQDVHESMLEHAAVLEGLRVRDAELARSAIAAHLQRTKGERLETFARRRLRGPGN
ncbi:GntR family transcriptional regulator [Rathayibacter sp. YIM 133350]|uniref:GntR family transcriptional regulator n=1 Tax=Rathayibacter sp. YIM 133350 TaxID=3131992 RepID=UPI00307FA9E4